MSTKLLNTLAECNLMAAAFGVAKGCDGGVFRSEVAAAISLFTKLPTPETALRLVAVFPNSLELMLVSVDPLPKEFRGPLYDGYDEFVEAAGCNLRKAGDIQAFLCREWVSDRLRVGFHRMRDQLPVYQRVKSIGLRKGIFSDRRRYLREVICSNSSAYWSVIDMVCIHGVVNGSERFWNALGAECEGQLHLQSEVLFDISELAEKFELMLASHSAMQKRQRPQSQ